LEKAVVAFAVLFAIKIPIVITVIIAVSWLELFKFFVSEFPLPSVLIFITQSDGCRECKKEEEKNGKSPQLHSFLLPSVFHRRQLVGWGRWA
jgi:hypothetical protein